MKAYLTPAQNSFHETREKGSRFYTYTFPIDNEHDVKKHLSELKDQYPDATHHCYAFKTGEYYRVNDDGEPNNSAGLPIYRQILSSGLDYVLIVVVRYFGGKKLGIPGLIKAYGEAAAQCLEKTEKVQKNPVVKYLLKASPDKEYQIFEVASRFHQSPEKTEKGYVVIIDYNLIESFEKYCEKFANLQVENTI